MFSFKILSKEMFEEILKNLFIIHNSYWKKSEKNIEFI